MQTKLYAYIFKAFMILSTLIMNLNLQACDIIFTVQGTPKTQYAVGDEIIVVITLKLSHRVCNETLEETKFNFTGLKVLGATKWIEINPGEAQRKFKLQVISDGKGNHAMYASRSCDKDGGRGSISFNVK